MTPDRTDETPDDDAEHGVLDDSGTLDTASISILGGHIAQVNVSLPPSEDDERDDDVIEDELPVDDIVVPTPDAIGSAPHDEHDALEAPAEAEDVDVVATRDIILEPHDEVDAADEPASEVHDAQVVGDENDAAFDATATDASFDAPATWTDDALGAAADDGFDTVDAGEPAADVPDAAAHLTDARVDDDLSTRPGAVPAAQSAHEMAATPAAEQSAPAAADENLAASAGEQPGDDRADVLGGDVFADAAGTDMSGEPAQPVTRAPWAPAGERADDSVAATEPEPEHAAPAPVEASAAEPTAPAPVETTAAEPPPPARPSAAQAVAPAASDAKAAEPASPTDAPATRAARAATGVIGTVPLTRREVQQADEAARVDRAHAMERVRTPAPEVALTSKRLGELDDARESAELLTADRLLDPRQIARPEPEGLWQQLVYSLSGHRINLGDGRRARARKDLDRRIASPLAGGARFVPVLSRKGGVGKTTVTALLGMALADARDDRIIAVDANPDRGTLADRVGGPNGRTVRDLVRARDDVTGYNDVSSIVGRDATRLDVLASDADPRVSEAFSDDDYRDVAEVAAHYYSIVLTDTGTGIVHSVMGATLEQADSLVIVAGLSVDEARLASETLTWLETNGYAARVRDAVVVLNNARPGTPLVRESELESHFRSRVRAVIRMPYDPHIATGSAIAFRDLQPGTRQAARDLAAAVVEGLRTPAAAA